MDLITVIWNDKNNDKVSRPNITKALDLNRGVLIKILRSVQNMIIFFADITVHIGTSVHVPLGCNLLMNIHYKFLRGKKDVLRLCSNSLIILPI